MKDIEKTIVSDFMGEGFGLIVEPSASFSVNLQSCLSQLGIPLSRVLTTKSFEEAKRIIAEKKPKLLISEYDLPPGFGLTLIDLQSELMDEAERVSIIVTKNSEDSTVAEAAEGSVDAFLLKPFSTDAFKQKFFAVLDQKKNPSPYQQLLRAGRKLAATGDFAGALKEFNRAKTQDPKPTLAYSYCGDVFLKQKDLNAAIEEFRAGRKFQPLHYKCLTGEFEALMALERHEEAYELVPSIRDNYPITSQRLGQIFMAAVYTKHFEDLGGLYQLYLKMENRSPWLIKLTSLALFTAGKYWIQKGDMTEAKSYFDMGLLVKGREFEYLEKVVSEFLKVDAIKPAGEILERTLPQDIGSAGHAQLRFRVDQAGLPKEQVIEKGRKLINDGQGSPEVYRIVVKLLAEAGKDTLAESIIIRAVKDHPDMKPELYGMLKS